MDVAWAAAGALAGLPAGTALRGTVFRLSVPSGEPERSACSVCAGPVGGWPVTGCGCCGAGLGAPAVLELITALVLALVMGRFSGRPVVVAMAFLGVLGVALAVIDVTVQRLPDRLVLPSYPVLAVLLAVPALMQNDTGRLVRALLGGLALAATYLLLALARPGELGWGDVKVAGLTGLVTGWLGWAALLAGAVLAFALSAAVSLVLLTARRVTLSSQIAFGPFLLGGALLAAVALGR